MEFPQVEILKGECTTINNQLMKLKFECDNFQKHAFNSINDNNDVFVCVPTSSGKTIVAKYAILHTILVLKKRVIYTSPIKSLSNEKYAEFKEEFTEYGISVGLLTGDNKIDTDSMCVIVTAEILRNALHDLKEKVDSDRSLNSDFVESIGCVIMDEIHFMNDFARGGVWEETIILLNNDIKLVMLSATVNEPEKFVNWISLCRNRKVSLIIETKRIIPLKHFIFAQDSLHEFLNEHNEFNGQLVSKCKKIYDEEDDERYAMHKNPINYERLNKLLSYMETNNLLQTIFFVFSRRKCEEYALKVKNSFVTEIERNEIEKLFDGYIRPYKEKYECVEQYNILKKMMMKGIAFHHAGLIVILKEIVELLFKRGLIKVLFATETFAVGVNTPTRTVVFTDLKKYSNDSVDYIRPEEYKQMSGRAGRRGLDKNGYVILLPMKDFLDECDLRKMVLGVVPSIESQFCIDLQFYLKMIQSKNIDINKFFEKSLINEKHKKDKRLLCNKKTEYENEFKNIKIDNQEDINISKICEYDNMEKLSQKQMKEYNKLMSNIKKNKTLKETYDAIKEKRKIIKNITDTNKNINDNEKYFETNINRIENFLIENKYIDDDKNVTIKGIIATQINNCDSIMLTEMISNNYFDDINIKEIILLTSIFVDTRENMHNISELSYDLEGDMKKIRSKIRDKICDLSEHLDNINIYLFDNQFQKYNVNLNYIEIVYEWISDVDVRIILEHLKFLEEYEGNFIKNMLKIYNIIQDLKGICKITKNNEMLVKLEKSDELILRDIVSVDSLYLL